MPQKDLPVGEAGKPLANFFKKYQKRLGHKAVMLEWSDMAAVMMVTAAVVMLAWPETAAVLVMALHETAAVR